jgi:hypothetical protein
MRLWKFDATHDRRNMTLMPNSKPLLIFAGLAAAMAATRLPMTASFLHLQDASWAVFFLAGFWLSAQWRRAFPGLMVVAVAVDLIAIRYLGIPNYCVTPAYWFLIPSYGALWLGGRWLRRNLTFDVRGAAMALASLLLSVSVCFLVSNGSFYWLGGRVDPTWQGWMSNFAAWYWPFLHVPLVQVGFVAVLYAVAIQIRRMTLRAAR